MSEYKCICKHPFTDEEKIEFEDILEKCKNNKKLRDYLWKIPMRKNIRFLHYIVRINERMEEVIKMGLLV